MLTVLIIIFNIYLLKNSVEGVLYLNDSEYYRMPPLYHLDPYEPCLHANNDTGVYCSVTFDLVTDEHSDLYDMITEYSAKRETRFNHSELTYGVCLTKSKHYQRQNETEHLGMSLEAHLNDTFWKKYKLKTKITNEYSCDTLDKKTVIEPLDIAVAVIIIVIVLLNIVGSLYEVFYGTVTKNIVCRILTCFAIRRNWARLVAPSGEGPDPRLTRLKGINCIKIVCVALVITFHCLAQDIYNADNPDYIEKAYQHESLKWVYQLMLNGTVMIQAFFVVTGFLVAYNMQLIAEKVSMSWRWWPVAIAGRWLRLTPTYWLILAFVATWMRHLGSGPLWQTLVMKEVEDCRRDWWLNMLYLNNYVDNSICMLHTWYIAVDTQLFGVGVAVLLMPASIRKISLILLLVVGILMPAVHTYFLDLDGAPVARPETIRKNIIVDGTFNNIYKRGHTNIPCYIIGIVLAMIVYQLQIRGHQLKKNIIISVLFSLTVLLMFGILLLNSIFYEDGPQPSIYIRMLFAAVLKPVWSAIFAVFLFGVVFQLEDFFRWAMEWGMWAVPSRLAYCMYLIHVPIVRYLVGTRTTLTHITLMTNLEFAFSCISMSMLAALPLYLFTEAPLNRLFKLCIPQKMSDTNVATKEEGKEDVAEAENKTNEIYFVRIVKDDLELERSTNIHGKKNVDENGVNITNTSQINSEVKEDKNNGFTYF